MSKGHILLIAALSASLALTGCDSGKDDDEAADKSPPQQTASDAQQLDAGDASEQAAPSQPRRLEGEVVFSATDISVPDDAELIISLRGVARGDAPPVTLAETRLVPGNEDPVRFRLDYDTGDVTPGSAYALQGEVRNANGELLWVSASRHGVEVGNAADQGPVTLTLEPVRAADASGSMQDTQRSMLSPPPPDDSVQRDAGLEGQADNVQEPSAAEAQPSADAPAERGN